MEANNNNHNNNNAPEQRDPLVNVRDRLFHTMFFWLSLAYARSCPRQLQRMLECFILLMAVLCLMMLVYIHLVYTRHSVQCLEHIKDSWPRDGILRVEVVKAAPPGYNIDHSYEKKKLALRHREDIKYLDDMFCYAKVKKAEETPPAPVEEAASSKETDPPDQALDEDITEEVESGQEEPPEYDDNIYNEIMGLNAESSSMDSDGSATLGSNMTELPDSHVKLAGLASLSNTPDHMKDRLQSMKELLTEKITKVVWPEDEYIVEYSLEIEFLRLSPAVRSRLNIPVHIEVLDPAVNQCFGDSFSRFILDNFLGYDDVLLSSIKSLAEKEDNKGYLRNVVTGAQYHFMSRWSSSSTYIKAAIVMMVFTISISMLQRYSQHQLFLLTIDLLQGEDDTFPAAPLTLTLTRVILTLVCMNSIMSEFFEDTTAFYIIVMVWLCDQYDAICCHTPITKRYWLRFFYLYHMAFYAYHFRFSGQYSGLALLTTWLFTQHSMLYFFHHYELPVILQQAQLREILMNNNNPPQQVNFGNGGVNNQEAPAAGQDAAAATLQRQQEQQPPPPPPQPEPAEEAVETPDPAVLRRYVAEVQASVMAVEQLEAEGRLSPPPTQPLLEDAEGGAAQGGRAAGGGTRDL